MRFCTLSLSIAALAFGPLAFQAHASPPIRIAVISDMNGAYGSTQYRTEIDEAIVRLKHLKPDAILCTGDMIASQTPTPLAESHVRSMWDAFHLRVTEPLARAGLAFAPTPGNHDASGYVRHERDRAIYQETWGARAPLGLGLVSAEFFPLRYAFRIQDALFISLDATTLGAMAIEQYEWLEAILKRETWARHTIVYGHVPLTPFTIGRERDTMRDDRLVELLARHRVTAYISGHSHGYYPGHYKGLRVISTGALGEGPRPLIGTKTATPRSLLWIELSQESSFEAWMGPGFTELLSRLGLPPYLEFDGVRVTRDDLSTTHESL
jgi:3',5'-cyclic AMP phosphodiesterase CpdA